MVSCHHVGEWNVHRLGLSHIRTRLDFLLLSLTYSPIPITYSSIPLTYSPMQSFVPIPPSPIRPSLTCSPIQAVQTEAASRKDAVLKRAQSRGVTVVAHGDELERRKRQESQASAPSTHSLTHSLTQWLDFCVCGV